MLNRINHVTIFNKKLWREIMIDTILFDLDGTLLQINNKEFEKYYFGAMAKQVESLYKPDEIIDLIWTCTKEMVKDTSLLTNEESFYTALRKRVSEERLNELQPLFDAFYEGPFDLVRKAVLDNQALVDAVNLLKEKGYRCVIATNPMFPKLAIEKRIEWTNINRDHFDYVTSFEKNHYCKPQPLFYEEILKDISANPENCLMVGNDTFEDMIAKKVGIQTYLVTDHIIEHEKAIEADYKGTMHDFYEFVKEMADLS